jgi:hypothetical protein
MLVAGCGSSGTRSPTATTSSQPPVPSRAQYIVRIDQICRASEEAEHSADARLKQIVAMHLSEEATAHKLAPLLRSYTREYRRFIREVAHVAQPRGDAETLRKIAIAHENGAAISEREVTAVEHAEGSAYSAARKEGKENGQHLHALERGYGFKVCGAR